MANLKWVGITSVILIVALTVFLYVNDGYINLGLLSGLSLAMVGLAICIVLVIKANLSENKNSSFTELVGN
ncbi:MAG: hypothetical protein FWB80_14080 [Defluviitaleaceae bacterium]|nr:hypothetical protein [Defluviitaleaceae bacterium]